MKLRLNNRHAESRVAALEQTFSIYQDDQPDIVQHMKAQADALQALSIVKSKLETYQSTFGPLATLSPDVAQLKEELEKKEAELQQLRLLEVQRREVCSDHLLCFLPSLNRPSSRTKPHYSLNWKNFPLFGNHLIGS